MKFLCPCTSPSKHTVTHNTEDYQQVLGKQPPCLDNDTRMGLLWACSTNCSIMTSNSSCTLLSLMDMLFAYLVKTGSFFPCSWRGPRYNNKTIQWISAQMYILKSIWKLESLVKLPAAHTSEFWEKVIVSTLLTQVHPTQKPMSCLMVLALRSHWSCLPVAVVYGIILKLCSWGWKCQLISRKR